MNFFFGIKNNLFKSEIQIPLFKNRVSKPSNLKLFGVLPKNDKWSLREIPNRKINNFFFILHDEDISNDEIYFLADEKIYEIFDDNKLKKFNSFTDTSPAYRANFKIYIENGGFSSFQSEYPHSMIQKQGTILSSISSLANTDAEKNFIIIKNIFDQPIQDIFNGYLVNIITKKIEHKYELKVNHTNFIEINNSLIRPEIFFITDKYLGIPIYLSMKKKFLSFEHTHPPHEYILSNNKYVKVSSLKKEINEILY
tara:strand:- start:116 stop:877 length:762 start_codon:yes stop_codon:yes gene_type:complete